MNKFRGEEWLIIVASKKRGAFAFTTEQGLVNIHNDLDDPYEPTCVIAKHVDIHARHVEIYRPKQPQEFIDLIDATLKGEPSKLLKGGNNDG